MNRVGANVAVAADATPDVLFGVDFRADVLGILPVRSACTF